MPLQAPLCVFGIRGGRLPIQRRVKPLAVKVLDCRHTAGRDFDKFLAVLVKLAFVGSLRRFPEFLKDDQYPIRYAVILYAPLLNWRAFSASIAR